MQTLTEDQLDMLHSIIFDECIYPSQGKYDEEETKIISFLLKWVTDEAKRRKLWWAR